MGKQGFRARRERGESEPLWSSLSVVIGLWNKAALLLHLTKHHTRVTRTWSMGRPGKGYYVSLG